MPNALAIGVSYEEFWHLNPHIISILHKGYLKKQQATDRMMWMMGMYVNDAVSVSIDHALNGHKAKSKYIDKPIMDDLDDIYLTEEERYEKELQKALLAEEQWIVNDKRRGLPTTTFA